jgi:hypothetical protein
VAGELLTWITALGAIGEGKPEVILHNPGDHEVFGVWRCA